MKPLLQKTANRCYSHFTFFAILTVLMACAQNSRAKFYWAPGVTIKSTTVTPASSCGGGSDGGIAVNTNGGAKPFTFVLTLPGGGTVTQATSQFSNLAAGIYSVTVTDNNSITATATGIVVAQATPLIAKATVNQTSNCGPGNDGGIIAGANGGTVPYHYLLTKPDNSTVAQTTPLFSNLGTGTYSVTTTDAQGCSNLLSVMVTQAAPIVVSTPLVLASNCGTGTDGRITVANTGGISPFHYVLTKPDNSTIAQNSAKFANLVTGTYSVAVTDAAGCTGSLADIKLGKAPPITVLPGVTRVSSCGSGADGSISIGRTGGVAPFSYVLTKPDNSTIAQTNMVYSNLAPGSYSVTITDVDGCTGAIAGVKVTVAPPVTAKAIPTAATKCGSGTDGSIKAGANGGVAPFQYVLTNPDNSTTTQTASVFGNLVPGTYSLTATDAAGCFGSLAGIVVKGTAKLTISPVAEPTTSCAYNNNENLDVVTAGGTAPYTYTLTHTYESVPFRTQTSPLFNNLYADTYNIGITDNIGCTATAKNFVLPEGPHPHFVDTTEKAPSCITATDGTITAGITGGTGPYNLYLEDENYNLLKVATGTSATFSGLPIGSYHVTANDVNTCSAGYANIILAATTPCPAAITGPGVSAATAADVSTVAGPLTVLAMPNPTRTVFVLAVTGAKTDPVEIIVTDIYGRAVHHANGANNQQYRFGQTFAPGMYIARVMQGREVRTVKLIKQ